MIDGVNDRPTDAVELAALARRLRPAAHVNLIPLNPTPGWPTTGSPAARVRQFRERLDDPRRRRDGAPQPRHRHRRRLRPARRPPPTIGLARRAPASAAGGADVRVRVGRRAAAGVDLEVQVRGAAGVAGVADVADHLALGHRRLEPANELRWAKK